MFVKHYSWNWSLFAIIYGLCQSLNSCICFLKQWFNTDTATEVCCNKKYHEDLWFFKLQVGMVVFVKSGLKHKVKESGQRARPETEQLKPAAIVKLETNRASHIVGITIHRPQQNLQIASNSGEWVGYRHSHLFFKDGWCL